MCIMYVSYISMSVIHYFLNIYIYIQRERERERELSSSQHRIWCQHSPSSKWFFSLRNLRECLTARSLLRWQAKNDLREDGKWCFCSKLLLGEDGNAEEMQGKLMGKRWNRWLFVVEFLIETRGKWWTMMKNDRKWWKLVRQHGPTIRYSARPPNCASLIPNSDWAELRAAQTL